MFKIARWPSDLKNHFPIFLWNLDRVHVYTTFENNTVKWDNSRIYQFSAQYSYYITLGVGNSKKQKCDSGPETHLERMISKFRSQAQMVVCFMSCGVALAVGHLNNHTHTNNFSSTSPFQCFFHKFCLLIFILLANLSSFLWCRNTVCTAEFPKTLPLLSKQVLRLETFFFERSSCPKTGTLLYKWRDLKRTYFTFSCTPANETVV